MPYYDIVDSPLGPVFAGGSSAGLHCIYFISGADDESRILDRLARDSGERPVRDAHAAADVATQLREYFAGERLTFDLPLAPRGTRFQERVWAVLREIPPATTTTYGAIAEVLGRPSASRAVGAANGRNPISIVVPCHRVIGANGTLTGYAAGVDRKRWLLDHERVIAARFGASEANADPGGTQLALHAV